MKNMLSSNQKNGVSIKDLKESDVRKFIKQLGEVRKKMFQKRKFNSGDFVFDKRYGEFGIIYGEFPRYTSDKGPRYAVLVISDPPAGETASSGEFNYRVRYSPQASLTPLDPPESMGGGKLESPTKENEVKHFCNNQCMFSECEDCIFEKYHLKGTDEDE